MKIKFWDEAEELIAELTIPKDQNQIRISMGDPYPWNTQFSLFSDFGIKQGLESLQYDLFSHIQLTPPINVTIVSNQTTSQVEWIHSMKLGQFNGLGTILNIWTVDQSSGNKTLHNQTIFPDPQDTWAVFSTQSGVPQESVISLQTYVE